MRIRVCPLSPSWSQPRSTNWRRAILYRLSALNPMQYPLESPTQQSSQGVESCSLEDLKWMDSWESSFLRSTLHSSRLGTKDHSRKTVSLTPTRTRRNWKKSHPQLIECCCLVHRIERLRYHVEIHTLWSWMRSTSSSPLARPLMAD